MGMPTDKNRSKATAELHRKAEVEVQLRSKSAEVPPPQSTQEHLQLVRELEVHQIELEMQNAELLRVRERLMQALDQYTNLYDFAPVGYCTIDRLGTVKVANLTIATLLDIKRSRLLGRCFGSFVADEDRQLFTDFLEKVLSCNEAHSCELKLAKEGNLPSFVRIEARSVISGNECNMAIIDVSGRRRVEESFHQTRLRLAWVLENTSIGLWLNEMPLDRLTWDAQTRRLFFVDPDVEPTIDLFCSRLHPDDREPTRLAVENAIRTRSLLEIEHRVVNPSTGEIRWIYSAGQATYATDGTPTHFDGITYDITERYELIDKLKQRDLQLSEAQRLANLGSWQWDAISDIVTGSEEFYRIFGSYFSSYQSFLELIHPDDQERVNSAVQDTLERQTPYNIYYRIVHSGGKVFNIYAQGRSITDDLGKTIKMIGTVQDFTERIQIEEKLQKSHDALEIRVAERTAELTQEIEDRKKAEISLKDAFLEIKRLKEQFEAENVYLQQEVGRQHNFGEIIGRSPLLLQVLSQVEQVAPMNATALLLGETGTGKGMVARAIHSRSSRKGRPLITVDCTTLPATLVESELFGRERGAFTGAGERQIGRFELADGGTIFLDEVGEMPLDLQSKLLRVIQDGEFERLGNPRTIKTDVRIIAATNRDLIEEVKNGRFREDLFYRLNVFPISLPPLRQRKEDIPLLVNYLVDKFNHKIGRKIETISKDTLEMLCGYHWPGNIRELENVIERAVITSSGVVLQLLDRFDTHQMMVNSAEQEIKALVDLEHDHILQTLQKTAWRVEGKKGAALLLGLNASTLRARMRKYGIARQ